MCVYTYITHTHTHIHKDVSLSERKIPTRRIAGLNNICMYNVFRSMTVKVGGTPKSVAVHWKECGMRGSASTHDPASPPGDSGPFTGVYSNTSFVSLTENYCPRPVTPLGREAPCRSEGLACPPGVPPHCEQTSLLLSFPANEQPLQDHFGIDQVCPKGDL